MADPGPQPSRRTLLPPVDMPDDWQPDFTTTSLPVSEGFVDLPPHEHDADWMNIPTDPMRAFRGAETIAAPGIGSRYLPTEAPTSLPDWIAEGLVGPGRPRTVAAQ